MLVAGEPIEERGLGRRRQQALGLMLTVDLDEVSPSEASADAVASWPPIRAVLLPSAETVRARMTSPSSAQSVRRPRERRTGPGPGPPSRRRARARQRRAAPSASASPTVTMVLPAPVSPVRTFRPGCSARSRSSMTPRPRCGARAARADPSPREPTSSAVIVVVVARQPELLPDEREEAGSVVPAHQARRTARGADPHPRPHRQLDALTAVGGQDPALLPHDLQGRPRSPGPARTSDRTPCAPRSASGPATRRPGLTIGPRAENEYAVEPVGVATITPSAEKVVT